MLWENKLYQEDLGETYEYLKSILGERKSILVTGVTGLIGSYLIDLLVYYNRNNNRKIKVYAMARNEKKIQERFSHICKNDDVHFIYQDLSEPIQCEDTVEWIVHLASNADPKTYAQFPISTILTNVEGTNYILEYAKNRGAKVLFASTMEVYGEVKKATILEEDTGLLEFDNARAGYPESKRVAEVLCHAYSQQYGLEFDIARLGYIYGPTMKIDDSKAVAQFLKKAIKKENIELKSGGKQRRSYCYVSDVVTALFFIMNCEKHNQIYNVSNKESIVTISELAHKIAEIGGTKVVYVEANLLEKQGYSKTRDAVLDEGKLRKQGWIPKKNIDQGVEMTIRILQNEKGV